MPIEGVRYLLLLWLGVFCASVVLTIGIIVVSEICVVLKLLLSFIINNVFVISLESSSVAGLFSTHHDDIYCDIFGLWHLGFCGKHFKWHTLWDNCGRADL